MRENLQRLTGPALAILLGIQAGCGGQAPAEPSAEGERLSALLPALMQEAGIPGLSIAVISDGEIAWTGAFGVADAESGEPVTEATLFEAASLSKPLFAYAVLRLVERGELDLDRPLHELLEYERFGGAERARALTARLVLSHQTGLPNWGGEVLEFGFEPGERFGYSGEGYVYLQRVLEARTGLTLEELARREVFEPLGMDDSRFAWQEGESFPLARGHDEGGTAQTRNPPEPGAASSLHTTASDFAKFVCALLQARGLEQASVDAAFTPAVMLRGDERGSERAAEIAGKIGWGLGWGVQEAGAGRIVWHWGDNDVFRGFVALDPGARRGVVYFANSSNGLAIARRVIEEVVGDMEPAFVLLDYSQSDEPGWAERRRGSMAAAAGDYPEAIGHFERALALAPDDEETRQRIEWLRDLVRIAAAPVTVPAERLRRYAGSYGPRKLRLESSSLVYQRDGRDAYRLLPLGDDIFALESMTDFRIRIETDETGRPVKLLGLYLGGDSDESPRDPD